MADTVLSTHDIARIQAKTDLLNTLLTARGTLTHVSETLRGELDEAIKTLIADIKSDTKKEKKPPAGVVLG